MADTGTIRVRRARGYDLNAVAALWDDCGLVPDPRGFHNEMEHMLIRSPELCLVAHDTGDGRIVGALLGSHEGRAATVSRLATAPARRRQGIASALVAAFAAQLEERGAGDAQVLVLDRTPDAERFWSAIGYDHIGDVAAYRRTS